MSTCFSNTFLVARKIYLHFRDSTYAHFADLNILYKSIDTPISNENIPFRIQNCESPNTPCHKATTTDYMVAENPLRRLYYKVYNEPLNYYDAKTQCESDGTRLAIPRSDAEEDFLLEIAQSIDSSHNKHLWIDMNDIEKEGTFSTIDGSTMEFKRWPKNEVLEAKFRFVCMDTTDFISNSKNDKPFDNKNRPYRKLNCELPNASCHKKPADDYLMAENQWKRISYKVYHVPMNYLAAKTRCERDGIRLAIPTSSAENNFLATLTVNEHMWIGINDINDDNNFVTVDGSKLIFTDWWWEPTPDNFQNGVSLFKNISSEKSGFWYYQDYENELKFICAETEYLIDATRLQKPPEEYSIAENSWGRSYYKIYHVPMPYRNAQAQCVADGANLAIPKSMVENDFIAGLIPDKTIWIGINDINKEGSFVTVDGSGWVLKSCSMTYKIFKIKNCNYFKTF